MCMCKVEQLLWVLRQKEAHFQVPSCQCGLQGPFRVTVCGDDSSTFLTVCESVFVCCLFSSTLYITRLWHGNCYMTIGCDPVKGMKSHVNFLEPEVSRIAICNLRIGAAAEAR